ncbi:polysaccharide biosynthesis protein GumN [Flavivirga aquatica]|uniref:Polysaccharide biosynthesis protein GumN n=1 Tax=Flavivirga aquatica TaxID=1849968 RepID=A0A1E5T470_9FLAO|nr:TraB/GumN family protein [Flavivirga aquatica]OEK06175.1 polysaccharide biosynthesis protein GumN [Flavivirga aquatica]
MKRILHLLILFISTYNFAQQKYQSLLWEVSGNGLEKSSFLYGTMHVSKKVAFRLDDVFYKALNKSECIALESDPSTWLEFNYNNSMFNPTNNSYNNNFYTNLFKLEHPNQLTIRNSIRIDSRLIEGYLYRKDFGSDNFEEETYLDMFIYQAGKKQKKPIISLENLAESRYLTTKASYNPTKKKPDTWLQKLFTRENPYFIQENTYRERNLDLLDSIGNAVNTPFFREHMLYKRNKNMVNVLDSLMHSKSIFSGIGAAHLPGKKGIINMLIEKGYTVKPLVSKQTTFGKHEKNKLDNLLIKPELTLQSTPDKFLTIKSFDILREFSHAGLKYYLAPDMTNGAFLTITRINTFEYLPHEKPISLQKIDNLLYEDIPGDIIKKEKLTQPFSGISILNKTKKGDYQKYHIYKTPLEIVIIKFGGKKDYVLNYEKDIFNSISFKKNTNKVHTFTSPYNKYSIEFPKYYTSGNINNSGKKLIQGKINNDIYFAQESPVHDISYIEEDKFEAKQIHHSFYKYLKIKETSGSFKNELYKSYISRAKLDSLSSKQLHLKSIVKDDSYYLLGYIGNNEKKAATYFNSFQFNNITYNNFKKVTDTSLYFSVNTNTKPIYIPSYTNRQKKTYDETNKETFYRTKANEQIYITRKKYHDLQMFHNIDSLWNSLDKETLFKNPFLDQKKLILSNKKKDKKSNTYTYSYHIKDTSSAKTILVKNILKQGVLYKLKTLTDSITKPSKFITEFYQSFTPKDTLLGKTIFDDKTAIFFKALKENDSLVLKVYSKIKFKEHNVDDIIDVIKNFDFPTDRINIKTNLIKELGFLNNKKINPFFKHLYLKSYSDPKTQSAILKALLNKNNIESYNLMMELIEKDLPLITTRGSYHFLLQRDSLQLKKHLFPNLLKYSTIKEYKKPIYKLLATLKDSAFIKPKLYKKYKNQIINDAKIEVKRSLNSIKNHTYSKHYDDTIENYVKLIFPFRKEKTAIDFFEKFLISNNTKALTKYYMLLKKKNEDTPLKLIEKTIKSPKNLWYTVEVLKRNKLNFNKYGITQKDYARSILLHISNYQEKDSLLYIGEKEFKTDKNESIIMYTYKQKTITPYNSNTYLHCISFIKPNNNEINTKVFYKNSIYIDGSMTDNEIIDDTIETIKHKTRKRITKEDDFYTLGFNF